MQGNYIGVNSLGQALGDGNGGVAAADSGIKIGNPNNTVGGTAAGAGNVISGNYGDGVLLDGFASGCLVQGNYIGTNPSGMTGLAVSGNGIEIQTSNNTIGSTVWSARNVIAGNSGDGVLIDSKTTGNLVQGNAVGTNV